MQGKLLKIGNAKLSGGIQVQWESAIRNLNGRKEIG